ncbi:hypothetical protein TWF481_005604 [Arthrobotrys musiformis]|uniref:Uncharacterized protein n=1 Tax=Arthrobotrys musiformis TaxID=47236 RepID=A0AAV9WFE9_9PEZI
MSLPFDPQYKEKVEQLEWPEELSEFKQPFDEYAAIVDAAWKAAEESSSSPSEIKEKFQASIAEHKKSHAELQKQVVAKIKDFPEFDQKAGVIILTNGWDIRIYNNLAVPIGNMTKYTTYGHWDFSPDDVIQPGDYSYFDIGEDLLGRCNMDVHYTVWNTWDNKPDIHLKWVFSYGTTEEFRADVAPGYAQPYYKVDADGYKRNFTIYHS